MKSKKNEELNFLYLDDKYHNNTKKKKIPQTGKKQANKKVQSKAKKENQNEVFNFDNEIVIGVTKISKEPEKKNSIREKQKKKQKAPEKRIKPESKKGADKKSAPQKIQKSLPKKENKKRKMIKNIVKWTALLSALIASFIFFMMSPLFNVVEIEVTGNNTISKETIISLSEIKIDDNIYKTSKEKIKQKVKQNAYIESIEVKRILPNKVALSVKERNTTYMLEYANSFGYINNQGYILEIATQKLEIPIITGYTTNQEELQAGNRLNKEDLNRLEMVLKIIESIQANGIVSNIDRIDISDKQNYKLYMEEDKKIVYLGDASNLSSRMLYLKAVLEDTKGLEGEIFVNGDLVKEKAFFRQKE